MSVICRESVELESFVVDLAERFKDVSFVKSVMEQEAEGGMTISVAVAYPALCILFSELHAHFPDRGYDECAHRYLEIVNNALADQPVRSLSLFDGLCGVGYAAYCMSDHGRRYQSFIGQLNQMIAEIAQETVEACREKPLNEFCYDIMYGLSGTAEYLLNFGSDKKIRSVLEGILRYLTYLCRIGEDGYPLFAVNADQSYLISRNRDKDIKYVNLGLSHGIPGILQVLCRTYDNGISVPGQKEAIQFLAGYLRDLCVQQGEEIFWEAQKILNVVAEPEAARDAWCYGTPGVAYSLLSAARILEDELMKSLAIYGMKCSMKRMKEIISPTFCHGLSGLCSLSRRFYEITGDREFLELELAGIDKIMEMYREEFPFGFKDTEIIRGQVVDKDIIGMLSGSCGILLTILAGVKPVRTNWESLFML